MTHLNYTCSRCGRAPRGRRDLAKWNVDVRRGVVTSIICLDCQTAAEYLEAEVNEATTIYGTDSFGRLIGTPKEVA